MDGNTAATWMCLIVVVGFVLAIWALRKPLGRFLTNDDPFGDDDD